MNFVADALVDGRKIRVLAVVDNLSRFCPSLTGGYFMSNTTVAHGPPVDDHAQQGHPGGQWK